MKTIHMCADIRGMLRNHSKKGSLKNTFTDDDGRKLSDAEAREYLYDCLAKGWRVIPMNDKCDNFDYKKGCPGHDVEE